MTFKTILSIATVSSFFATAVFSADAGSICGKATLKGQPPGEKKIDFSADPKCAAGHSTAATTSHYVADASGNLANVFVYVKDGLAAKKFDPPAQAAVLDQQACIYHPYVLGVQVGQTLTVQNSDSTAHNVHYVGKSGEGNISQPTQGAKNDVKLTKPDVFVEFKCDVHPWMKAYVGVVAHPFFAVTGADGCFKISGLPDGEYTLAAVHPKAGTLTAKVKVAGGEAKAPDFVFAPKAK